MDQCPNIVLITTDQQRHDTLHAAGNPHIRTPHLDWLLDTGIQYTRAYSDCPVCMPARATIMMGQYAYNHGLTSNGEVIKPIHRERSLPAVLTRAGYQTRAQGKMHFAPMRCHYGFEEMEIIEHYYRTMQRNPHRGRPMNHGMGQNEMFPCLNTVDDTNSLTHWTVDRSMDFLDTRDDTRPFFLWTSFTKPHPPYDPSPAYWSLYDSHDMPLPIYGGWSEKQDQMPGGFCASTYGLNNVQRFDARLLQDMKRAYYACITQIDYNLGLLFSKMRELNLLHNTLIIFTSDHGDMLGDHHLGAKSIGLEGAAHVPLIVRLPGENDDQPRRGIRSDALVCLADIMPTILDYADVEPPAGQAMDGINMLDAADGKAEREMLFGESGPYHFVLREGYKYLFSEIGGDELFFNLAEDPCEQHNLVDAAEHQGALQDLRGALTKRLTDASHRAVNESKLVATQSYDVLVGKRANPWPGFHTMDVPTDVLH